MPGIRREEDTRKRRIGPRSTGSKESMASRTRAHLNPGICLSFRRIKIREKKEKRGLSEGSREGEKGVNKQAKLAGRGAAMRFILMCTPINN